MDSNIRAGSSREFLSLSRGVRQKAQGLAQSIIQPNSLMILPAKTPTIVPEQSGTNIISTPDHIS